MGSKQGKPAKPAAAAKPPAAKPAPAAKPPAAKPPAALVNEPGAQPANAGNLSPGRPVTALVHSQEEAKQLDAADGVIDGKYFGADIKVRPPNMDATPFPPAPAAPPLALPRNAFATEQLNADPSLPKYPALGDDTHFRPAAPQHGGHDSHAGTHVRDQHPYPPAHSVYDTELNLPPGYKILNVEYHHKSGNYLSSNMPSYRPSTSSSYIRPAYADRMPVTTTTYNNLSRAPTITYAGSQTPVTYTAYPGSPARYTSVPSQAHVPYAAYPGSPTRYASLPSQAPVTYTSYPASPTRYGSRPGTYPAAYPGSTYTTPYSRPY